MSKKQTQPKTMGNDPSGGRPNGHSYVHFLDAPAPAAEIDSSAISEYLEMLPNGAIPSPHDQRALLKHLGISMQDELTLNGALLFSKHPDNYIPTARVTCKAYSGIDRSNPKEKSEIRGPLLDQLKHSIEFIKNNTNLSTFPNLSFLEILTNALIHRDYSDTQRSIQIRAFSDRVEILSPGTWGGNQPSTLAPTPIRVMGGESVSRNYRLARLLEQVDMAKLEGSGLSQVASEFLELGLQEPTVLEQNGYVAISLALRVNKDGTSQQEKPIPEWVHADTDDGRRWNLLLEEIRKRISPQSYEAWFSSITLAEASAQTLTVAVPNRFTADWVTEHFMSVLQTAATESFGRELSFKILVEPSLEVKASPSPEVKVRTSSAPVSSGKNTDEHNLHPRYTFDGFVVGSANRLSHAASRAVFENLAGVYNPLFLYSGVGLGKTHLMQAIGNEVIAHRPETRVRYITSETFTNEMIVSIQHGKTLAFRSKYRGVDLLLIDDVQFLSGKESTQEEFFHTFNALHDAGKQIVITADRPPKSMRGLEERLASRFQWGLVTDIQPPDLETRVAILRMKGDQNDLKLPEDVAYYIAESVRSNVRELEGALVRLLAYAGLKKTQLTIDVAKVALRDFTQDRVNQQITVEQILELVTNRMSISVDAIKSKRRTAAVTQPRQIGMFLSRTLTSRSLSEIGRAFGGRDHTTVHYACERVNTMLEDDPEFRRFIKSLEDELKSDTDKSV